MICLLSQTQDVTKEVAKYVEVLNGEEFRIAHHRGIKFENYAISNYARVFTFNKNLIMSQRIQKKNYCIAKLSKNGKTHYIGTHRLVAFAFIKNENQKEYTMINHIDENPRNNHWTNLAWCNCKENLNWGTAQIRRALSRSKAVNVYKADSNEFIGMFESMPKAALACSTTASTVCTGCKTRIPKKGFIFEYA